MHKTYKIIQTLMNIYGGKEAQPERCRNSHPKLNFLQISEYEKQFYMFVFGNKLKHYSGNTMGYWKNQRVGGGGLKVLELYKSFPVHSDFIHPKHVPLDVKWARFSLESDMRLIGFVVPNDLVLLHKIPSNIFNVVFLDQHHRFYKTEEK